MEEAGSSNLPKPTFLADDLERQDLALSPRRDPRLHFHHANSRFESTCKGGDRVPHPQHVHVSRCTKIKPVEIVNHTDAEADVSLTKVRIKETEPNAGPIARNTGPIRDAHQKQRPDNT